MQPKKNGLSYLFNSVRPLPTSFRMDSDQVFAYGAQRPQLTLHIGEDAMFDGFVNGLDDPLGSAVKAFQMLAGLRAPGTLNCMDYEDCLSVFAAGRPVRVFAVEASALTHASWTGAYVLTNGTDVVVVFDSKTGRLNTIKEVLSAVRASPWFHEDEGPSLRYLGTKKYFRSRA